MDARAAHALGWEFYGVVAVDTQQDEKGLHAAQVRNAAEVAQHCRKALASGEVRAIKTGALGDEIIVSAVAECFSDFPDIPLVVDPVRRASRIAVDGAVLLTDAGWDAMKKFLFPLATLVTPNLEEWNHGVGYEACAAVLVTGIAGANETILDRLLRPGLDPSTWTHPRVVGHENLHGTGCMLSTLIAGTIPDPISSKQASQPSKSIGGQNTQIAGTMLDKAISHALEIIADGTFR